MSRVWEWLKTRLTNRWMNSVAYLAAMAHVGWACLLMLLVALLSGRSIRACMWASIALVIFAAGKEWLYDANFEIPKQTFRDNAGDFLGYLGGIALSWIILLAAIHIHP